MDDAAAGFRVKSGRAIAVLLAGPASTPGVVDRRDLLLADPAVPESCQPYHAGLDLSEKEGAALVARLVQIVERFSRQSVQELLERYGGGHRIVGAGIVVGSDTDPATIKNDHIRAHAEEGRLFRVVIEDATRRLGLQPTVTVEKQIFKRASKALRRPEPLLKSQVRALGRGIDGPWRAEEKAATVAAWMLLL